MDSSNFFGDTCVTKYIKTFIVYVHNRNAIDCEVLTGTERNKRIFIPRINLTYSGTILLFNFQISQFPIIAAFAMTINKSQKQTFEKIAILLRQPVFNCTSQQVEFDHSMV
jgi:hypothetical protein